MGTVLTQPRVLWRLLRGQPGHSSLARRLRAFYAPQAEHYDRTRASLLHGRRLLADLLDLEPGQVLVELGAGTGANLDFFGPAIDRCREVHLVDLCSPLLAIARQRAASRPAVRVIEADAVTYRPGCPVDVVVLSYALTMIPDWFRAVDNALAMLAPGGRIAVADFHVSRREPPAGLRRQSVFTRHFWPLWFGHDGVRPNPDHLPYLMARFDTSVLVEQAGAIPGLPFLRMPYYVFIGRKPRPCPQPR